MGKVRAEYIISNGTYFRTGFNPAGNTAVYADFEVVNYLDTNNYVFGVFSPSYYSSGSIGLNTYSTNYLRYYIGGKYNDNAYQLVVGHRYRCTLTKTSLIVNDVTLGSSTTITITGANLSATTEDLTIGALNAILDNKGINSSGHFKFYEVIIYEYGAEIKHLLPYGDTDDGYGYFYNTISGEYLTAYEPSKTSYQTSFSISPDSASFPNTGGSSAITITSTSDWTASTNNSWITINPSDGTSAVTSTTVTVSENMNFSARTGTVTFTDGENSVYLSVNQEKSPNKVFLKNLYREDEPIRMLIRNGSIIYREFFNLVFNVDVDSLTFDVTGGTQVINITANDNWTMTLPEWLTASSVSGKSSATVYLTAGENTGTTPLTGTITISCGGKTKEISVRQNTNIHYVSCIYWSGGVGTSINYMINTNFNATTDTVMRINYIGRGVANGDTVMGYSFNMPNCPDDNSDYRLFNYRQRAYFDFNTSRIFGGSGEYSYADNVEYDISVGNNYIYDNINSSIVASGTAQTSIAAPLATIYVHVACIKLKSFQIYRGGSLVFDGKAAENDGVVGLYDSVSGTMVTNPDIGLIYEE